MGVRMFDAARAMIRTSLSAALRVRTPGDYLTNCLSRMGLTAVFKTRQCGRMSTPSMLIQPYLFFGGRCEEALEFYRTAIGAEVEMLMRYKDSPDPHGMPECFSDKVMHASFRVGATMVMASDGQCEGPANFEGFSLSINVPDEAEADRVFTALAEGGGLVTMPLEKTFWTPKFGMLQDRFGVGWMVSVMHKPQAGT